MPLGPAADQRFRGIRLLGARRRSFGHLRRSLRRGPQRSRHASASRRNRAPICTSQCSSVSRRRWREATRAVTVNRRETCRTCAGTGRTRMSTGTCHVCQGSGAVRSVRGHMVFSRSCPACGGSGQQRPRPCEPCGGIGQETRTETVQVRIPAGVQRRRSRPRGRKGQRRPARRAARRSVHHHHRRPPPDFPPRRRRRAHGAADRGARGGAGRAARDPVTRRHRAAASAAGHAVGPAVPLARARRAVQARRTPRRSRSSRCG